MTKRPITLPPGWYPRSSEAIEESIAAWVAKTGGAISDPQARAAISPHAGWSFCGAFMAQAVGSLDAGADCLVVFGGHIPAGASPLMALEDSFETPLGSMKADCVLRDALRTELGAKPDIRPDNTVEVILPMARRFLPSASLLWLRVPNDESSIEIGRLVARKAMLLGRKAVAVGSTDLTHYGMGYGFAPKGRGSEAEAWVRDVNDAAIIRAFLAMDGGEAIALGESSSAACSAGAAAAAIAFAHVHGALRARLLGYGLSSEVHEAEDFVGYAALSFS